MPKLVLLLIAGGEYSGKQTISRSLLHKLTFNTPDDSSSNSNNKGSPLRGKVVELDTEYATAQNSQAQVGNEATIGPRNYDFKKLYNDILHLKQETEQQTATKTGDLVLIVHGKYALHDSDILSLATLKIFIDCDPDTRLTRSLQQSVVKSSLLLTKEEKDLKFRDIIDEYFLRIKPEFEEWIIKTRVNADLILRNDYDRFLEGPDLSSAPSTAGTNSGRERVDKEAQKAEDMILELLSDGVLPLIKQRVYLKKDMIERRHNPPSATNLSSASGFNFMGEVFDGEKERFYDLS
ncbi:hypothetical protein WICPIJ_009267 [Wickerhamomyces pijperi]|uniref:Phosphoribulokinase/uridine kinase domain-containing protein n=1 Tax=Wickerhamomyces pijperi TaxID=599730 RepID=A0A9P8TEG8_WICPI|nr:hypothetical protein WICPIJ_009267 [Wickerhamomyces pijperi]